MKLVAMQAVTDAILTSNVPVTEPIWNSTTAYSTGAERAHGKRMYRALQASTNKEPGTSAGALFWYDIGPTNKWAMFDDLIDTQTVNPESIEIMIEARKRFDTVGLFGIEAASVNITVTDGTTELFNQDYDLIDYSGIVGYWSLWFEEHDRTNTLVVEDLPILSGLTLKVSAEQPGGDAKIGALDYGRSEDLGATLIGPTLGFLSSSKIAPNELGQRAIVKRTSRKQGDFDVAVPNLRFDTVYKKIISYDAVPVLAIGSSLYEAMIYRGLIIGAKMTLPFHEHPILRISFEDF